MEPYQERVLKERKQLNEQLKERLVKLINLLNVESSPPMSDTDKHSILDQAYHMSRYIMVFNERIKRFNFRITRGSEKV